MANEGHALDGLNPIDLRIDEECRNPEFLASYIAAHHDAAIRRWKSRFRWLREPRPSVAAAVLDVLGQIERDAATRLPSPPKDATP